MRFGNRRATRALSLLAVVVLAASGISSVQSQQSTSVANTLALAKQLDIGSFCLTNLPSGSVKVLDSVLQANRTWFHVKIDLNGGPASGARAYIFDRPPASVGELVVCSASVPGTRTVLAGTINRATIEAYYSFPTDTQAAAWIVEKDGLHAELGKVTARFGALFGGQFDPAQRLLWINNPSRLHFANAGGTKNGTIRMEATDVSLKGARLQLGADYPTMTADLRAVSDSGRADKGHVSFDLDVQTGGITLADGMLFANDVAIPAGTLHTSYVEATIDGANARSVALMGSLDGVNLVASDIDAKLSTLKHTQFPLTNAVPVKNVTLKTLSGAVAPSTDVALLGDPDFQGLRVPEADIAIGSGEDGRVLRGRGQIKVASLSPQAIDGEVSIPSPSMDAMDFIVGANGMERLKLAISGNKADPTIDGSAVVRRLSAGQMQWTGANAERLPISLRGKPGSALELNIPFDIDLKSSAGRLEFRLPDGRLTLDGRTDAFKARGVLTLSDQAVEKVKLAVAPNSLSIRVSGQAAHEPLLFGGTPTFSAGVNLAIAAPGGFVVTPAGATGKVAANVGVLVVSDGSLAFSNKATGMRVAVPLRTSADTQLGIDLSNMGVSFESGTVDVQHLTAESVDGAVSELGGLAITAPKVSIDRLTVSAADGNAQVAMSGLSFDASHIEHAQDPYFSADLTAPLVIQSASSRLGSVRDSMRIVDGSLVGMTLGTAHTTFRSHDGASLQGASASVDVRRLADDYIDASIGIADGDLRLDTKDSTSTTAVRTHFDRFAIQVAGQKGALDGTGALRLTDLSVSTHTRLAIADCPEKQQWKIRASVELGRVDLNLQMKKSELQGELKVANGKFNARNDGYSRCEFDKTQILVEEKRAKYEYPCFRHWKWYSCDGWTILVPEVKAVIHWVAELHDLQVSGRIDDTRVSLRGERGLRVCPGKITLNPPLIVANYHPNFKEGGFVQNLVRDLIRTVASAFESTIANLIGTGASATTYLRNAVMSEQCYG